MDSMLPCEPYVPAATPEALSTVATEPATHLFAVASHTRALPSAFDDVSMSLNVFTSA